MTRPSTAARSSQRPRARAGSVSPVPTPVSPAPARHCAYAVLRRVFEHGAYADLAFRGRSRGLHARDRALAMRLAYGAVQRKGTLDYVAEQLAERPLQRLDAPVRAALRLGLYELLYLHGAPDRAVVADAVELAKGARDGTAKHVRGAGAAGLVNAVLRRGAREGRALLDALDDREFRGAALLHSHPEWLAQMWWEALGAAEARALLAADNEPAEVALRVNTLRSDRPTLRAALPVASHEDPCLAEALILDGPFDARRSDAWRAGAFIAQSRAAMLVSRVLRPLPDQRVLDLCAAPGGKSTHLAALMRGRGEVLAVERNARRAQGLARTAHRLGAENVHVEIADARSVQLESGGRGGGSRARAFDRVLVDPPCSGLGTLQGNPDLRWRMTPRHVHEMAGAQAAMLARAADALRPGGSLVYSTCTISPTENERLIAAFLDSHHDFQLEDLGGEWPSLRMSRVSVRPCRGEIADKVLLTLPHHERTAGFFIARLRRS
jgi:16S rRNA (cytosine967-C5)-methyltransferase